MGYTLVYDSGCGPCTAFMRVVGFLDPARRMRYEGIDQAEREGLLSRVPPAARRRSFHLVAEGGEVLSGTGALAALASQLPLGEAVSAAMTSVPPLSGAVGFAYSALSRMHGAGACGRGGGRGAPRR
jgi:predicted DCC family thiol-disulfide oxidoreductase YuxK